MSADKRLTTKFTKVTKGRQERLGLSSCFLRALRVLRGEVSLCIFLSGWLFLSARTMAADAAAGRKVAEANKALAAGRVDDALKAYEEVAGSLPESAELAYNRGVAYYRKGDRAKAAESFEKALATRDIRLEARAKFNLGNCAYADALEKQSDTKAALEKLKVAIAHYKDVIAADPNDVDAKVNIETAQLLMKHLLDQEKKKQDEQKKNSQSQPSSQPESQPSSQPESQPEQPQSQPASQPESDQQQKDQQKQGEQQKKDGEQKEQDQAGKQEDGKQGDKGEKLESQEGEKKEGEQKDAQAAEPAEMLEMSKEEAEKLLQMIRDRERQRREALLQLRQGKLVPVDKDW